MSDKKFKNGDRVIHINYPLSRGTIVGELEDPRPDVFYYDVQWDEGAAPRDGVTCVHQDYLEKELSITPEDFHNVGTTVEKFSKTHPAETGELDSNLFFPAVTDAAKPKVKRTTKTRVEVEVELTGSDIFDVQAALLRTISDFKTSTGRDPVKGDIYVSANHQGEIAFLYTLMCIDGSVVDKCV